MTRATSTVSSAGSARVVAANELLAFVVPEIALRGEARSGRCRRRRPPAGRSAGLAARGGRLGRQRDRDRARSVRRPAARRGRAPSAPRHACAKRPPRIARGPRPFDRSPSPERSTSRESMSRQWSSAMTTCSASTLGGPSAACSVKRRGPQGPMHAGGAFVRGRAPHAVIDAHRRRDLGVGDAELAETLRRIDVRHGFSERERRRELEDSPSGVQTISREYTAPRRKTDCILGQLVGPSTRTSIRVVSSCSSRWVGLRSHVAHMSFRSTSQG